VARASARTERGAGGDASGDGDALAPARRRGREPSAADRDRCPRLSRRRRARRGRGWTGDGAGDGDAPARRRRRQPVRDRARFLGAIGYDKRQIGVVMGAFNLASLAMAPVVARLIARLGFARVIAGGCALAAIGAAVFAQVDTLAGYATARAIQGAGMACLTIGAAAYVAESSPIDRLAQALGAAGVFTLVAMALGPALAQLIHDHAGWPWVWRAGVISGVAAVATTLRLPPVARHDGPAATGDGVAWGALVAMGLAGVGFGAIWSFLADYAPRVGVPRVTAFFTAYVVAANAARLARGGLSDRLAPRLARPTLVGHALALAA
jgi:MFS family permease